MSVLFNSFEDDWDSWNNVRESLDSISNSVTVSGVVNLWDGPHSIYPENFSSIEIALNKCLGKDIDEFILRLEDNVYKLDCYHHDGINHFNIELN